MTSKSIAIIGAGPAGLASLYEFLHTNKDGSSTLTDASKTYKDVPKPKEPAFTKIIAFEQKDKAGGIWAPSETADFNFPPQEIAEYHNPAKIRPTNQAPQGIETATLENSVAVEHNELINELEWSRSGVFPFLFTNIPTRFTRYSYLPNEEEYLNKERKIYPFLTQQELSQRFSTFIEEEGLNEYIRTSSTVESVEKANGKWLITIRKKQGNKSHWYTESFDFVVVANGHYTVPYIPHIDGLVEYHAKFPTSLIHAKSFRNLEEFKDKQVLVVGGSISTTNILQYVIPIAKSVTNSKRGPHGVFPWINDALVSKGIEPKGPIHHFDAEKDEVHFADGSVGKYDKIIFSTGYHYHFPFLRNELKLINPGNLSRVGGLFLNTFDQQDSTLGAVGITVSQLNFHTIEASAAALAGVWSGAKNLPSLEEQQEWEKKLVAERGDSLLFHYYNHHQAKEYVDALAPYFPTGRYNPLEVDGALVGEVDEGFDYLEKLFYGLKDGKIRIEETNPSYKAISNEKGPAGVVVSVEKAELVSV